MSGMPAVSGCASGQPVQQREPSFWYVEITGNPKRRQRMKKNGSVIKLVLSGLSLLVGIVWLGAFIILLGSMGGELPLWRLLILLLFSAMFLFLGIRGLLAWRKDASEKGVKIPKAVPIILGVVAVLLVIQMTLTFPYLWKNGQLSRALKPYVKEDYSAEDVKLPENPRFVFYHNGSFSVPSSRYRLGTDDPNQVNVVVAYDESVSKNGIWVDSATGEKVSDARVQNVKLYVIRKEDWALIDEVKFSQRLKQNENGVNVLGMNSVENYLNSLGQ